MLMMLLILNNLRTPDITICVYRECIHIICHVQSMAMLIPVDIAYLHISSGSTRSA